MRLPIDVAQYVALVIKSISSDDYTEKDSKVHSIAVAIVNANLLADTIAWRNYIVGVDK